MKDVTKCYGMKENIHVSYKSNRSRLTFFVLQQLSNELIFRLAMHVEMHAYNPTYHATLYKSSLAWLNQYFTGSLILHLRHSHTPTKNEHMNNAFKRWNSVRK